MTFLGGLLLVPQMPARRASSSTARNCPVVPLPYRNLSTIDVHVTAGPETLNIHVICRPSQFLLKRLILMLFLLRKNLLNSDFLFLLILKHFLVKHMNILNLRN